MPHTAPNAPEIRVLNRAEVGTAVDWAAREGWNPGFADADAFLAQDPEGFLGLFAGGALAVTISVVTYGASFAFLGFYICRPDLRGRGLGLALWQAGMARLGARTVGLDGVVAQQDNYARSGFVLSHRNVRHGGPAPVDGRLDHRIRAVDGDLSEAVAAFDRARFGFDRPDFLAHWLNPPMGRALALVEGGDVAGYGVVRRCREGFKIGPLFATGPGVAQALFSALADEARGAPIFLDVPESNGEARALAARAGLSPVFETARMYRGPAPALPIDDIYGITSFELG